MSFGCSEAEDDSFMDHYGDEIEGNAVYRDEPYVNELEAAVNALWAELHAEGVAILREERPEVVALCQQLHERYFHGLGDPTPTPALGWRS